MTTIDWALLAVGVVLYLGAKSVLVTLILRRHPVEHDASTAWRDALSAYTEAAGRAADAAARLAHAVRPQ